MKIANLFKFAFTAMYRKKGFLLIEIIMITISLCLINHGLIRYYDANLSIIKLKENIASELDDTYKITFGTIGNMNNTNGEAIYRFVEGLKDIAGIKVSGKFYIEGLGMALPDGDGTQAYGMDVLLLDEEMLEIKQLYNVSGEKIQLENEEYVPLILGYNYKDVIPVGTKLVDTFYGRKYIVSDVLRQGETWMSTPILMEGAYELQLDNMCISLSEEEEIFIGDGWFTCFTFANNVYVIIDDDDRNSIINQINELAEKEKTTVIVQSIPELIEEYKLTYEGFYSETNFQVIMLWVLTLIGLMMTMKISLKLQSNNIKIMYTYGVSRGELIKIHVISQIIIYMLAFLLAKRLLYFTTENWYNKDINYVHETAVYNGLISVFMFAFVEIFAVMNISDILRKSIKKGD